MAVGDLCWVKDCREPATHSQMHSGEELWFCEAHWRAVNAKMKLGQADVRH